MDKLVGLDMEDGLECEVSRLVSGEVLLLDGVDNLEGCLEPVELLSRLVELDLVS